MRLHRNLLYFCAIFWLQLHQNILYSFSYINIMLSYIFYVQNNLHELWALLNFLLPEIFSSAETFDEWFQISGENDQQEVVQQLHKVRNYLLVLSLEGNQMSWKNIWILFILPQLVAIWYVISMDFAFPRSFGHFFSEDWNQMLRKVCLPKRKPYWRLACPRCRNSTTRLCCRKILKL